MLKHVRSFIVKYPFWTLIILGIVTFLPTLFNDFVWDDLGYILDYPDLTNFVFTRFFGNNLYNNTGEYRPLMLVYFALCYAFFGKVAFFYHIIQIGLHILNATLLFRFARRWVHPLSALFLAAVFLVHPAQMESVGYISGAGNVLYFLCGIGVLLHAHEKWTWKEALGFYSLLFVGMLVKETGVVFLLVTCLYRALQPVLKPRIELPLAAIVIGLYLYLRFGVAEVGTAVRPMIPVMRLDLWERLALVPHVVFHNLKTLFFPVQLGVNQQWLAPELMVVTVVAILSITLVGVLAIWGGVYVWRHKKALFPAYGSFLVWLACHLGLHSQIVPLNMTVADRWLYSMLVGAFGVIVVFYESVHPRLSKRLVGIIAVVAAFFVLALAVRGFVRAFDWRNQVTLFEQAISIHDNYLSRYQLSIGYQNQGNLEKATENIDRSIAQSPMNLNLYQRGYLAETANRFDTAIAAYQTALTAPDYIPDSHRNPRSLYIRLANLQLLNESYSDSFATIRIGLADYPEDARLWALAAIVKHKTGDNGTAMEYAEKAVGYSKTDTVAAFVYTKLLRGEPIEYRVGSSQ